MCFPASEPPTPDPEPVKERTFPEPCRVHLTAPSESDFASDYQPIIEYNFFRPLGWTPSRRVELYRLVGMVFSQYTETPPQAVIETTGGSVLFSLTETDSYSYQL